MIKGILKRAARPFGVAAAVAVLTLAAGGAQAQVKEQFVPVNLYWVGPYAPGGSGVSAGWIDYMTLINERDGGINGVKLTWEKCETEYNNARGVECYESSKNKAPTGAAKTKLVPVGG